jgi:hypothetical protein
MPRFSLSRAILIVALAAGLAACQSNEVLPPGGNPIPTPLPGEIVGTEPISQAAAIPEETVSRYLKDSIAAQVAAQQSKISLRERYQDPALTAQDLGGLIVEIAVLEDRTAVTLPKETAANAHVDLDIRVKFANGDTDTRTCQYEVNMQRGENTEGEAVWYVVNPEAFPIFVNCKKK